MDKRSMIELTRALKRSKDVEVCRRALAVRMVLIRKESIEKTANILLEDPDWVEESIARFEEKGVAGLSDPKGGSKDREPHKR